MCDIWKAPEGKELAPEQYLGLPAGLRHVDVSGGEPFMRPDLLDVLAAIHQACPRARLVLSSNGLLLDRIRSSAPRLAALGKALAVRVSIDGIGETHDRLRGVPGAYDRARQALVTLAEAGVEDLGIGLTLMACNLGEMEQVYRLAETLGIEFSLSVATSSPGFFGEDKSLLRPQDSGEIERHLRSLIRDEARHRQPKHWFRAWFEAGLLHYLLHGERVLPCDAGVGFFYLAPDGEVHCCHVRPSRLGSLGSGTWDELWQAPEAEQARRAVRDCARCWMVCTARTEMRRRLPAIALQVAAIKLAAHLRASR